jgi:hypothetical protein
LNEHAVLLNNESAESVAPIKASHRREWPIRPTIRCSILDTNECQPHDDVRLEVSGPAPRVCSSILSVFVIPSRLRADGVLVLTVDSLGEHLEMASAREIVSNVSPVASMTCIDGGESFAERGLDARLIEQRAGRGGVAGAVAAQNWPEEESGTPRHGFAALVSFVGSARSAARAVGAWFRLSMDSPSRSRRFAEREVNAACLKSPPDDFASAAPTKSARG